MSNQNLLMLHSGGRHLSLSELEHVPTPAPTPTWRPIPHASLWNMVVSTLFSHGIEVVRQEHAINKKGNLYFGIAVLSVKDVTNGQEILVAIRNSHNQLLSVQFTLGGHVFVCDNLMFFGDLGVLKHKHTPNVFEHMQNMVNDAVLGLPGTVRQQSTMLDSYRKITIDQTEADHLIMEMYRRKILPSNRLGVVDRIFASPSTSSGGQAAAEYYGSNTLHTLYQASTEAMKGTGALDYNIRGTNLTMLMNEVVDEVNPIQVGEIIPQEHTL